MIPFSFVKMHGLGNDFVVLDAFVSSFSIGKEEAKASKTTKSLPRPCILTKEKGVILTLYV